MKKTSSPPPSFSCKLLIFVVLVFLGTAAYTQEHVRYGYKTFNEGVRVNGDKNPANTRALSLHTRVPFEMDAHGVIGGRFRVTSGEESLVGIGNPAPQYPLDLVHEGGTPSKEGTYGVIAQILNSGYKTGIHLGGNQHGGVIASIGEKSLLINPDGGNIHLGSQTNSKLIVEKSFIRVEKGILSLHPDVPFEVDAAGARGARFKVDTKGNVGIGVTAPKFKLDVLAPAGTDKAKAPNHGWVTQFSNSDNKGGVRLGARRYVIDSEHGGHPLAHEYIKKIDTYGTIGTIDEKPLVINPDGGQIHVGDIDHHITHARLYVHGSIHIDNRLLALDSYFARDLAIGAGTFEVDVHGDNHISGGRFIVTQDGKVGIGVPTPSEKLEVNGNIKATGKIIADGGIQMNGSEALSFSNDGNVGIGIETPGFVIDVRATEANPSYVGWTSAFVNEITDSGIHLGGRERDVEGVKTPYGIVGTYKTTPMVLNPDGGNVGIGVTAPTEKLEVAGSIKATGNLLLENDDDSDNPIPVFQVSTAEQLTFIGSEAYTKWTENNTNKDSELYKNKDKYSLWVSKGIVSEDYVMASVDAWADYVFDPGYKLRSLEELSHFVRTNKHLPNIPSEAEVKQEGYSLHELNRGFLKTMEELTLYTLAQEEKITDLEAQLEQYEHLSDEVAQLKAVLSQLQQDQD